MSFTDPENRSSTFRRGFHRVAVYFGLAESPGAGQSEDPKLSEIKSDLTQLQNEVEDLRRRLDHAGF